MLSAQPDAAGFCTPPTTGAIVGFTTSDAVHILAAGTSIREVVADWRGLVPEPEIDVELPDSFVRFADAMFDLEES